jgi:acyl carrier protein
MSASNSIELQIRQFLAANFGFRGANAALDGKLDLLAEGILDSTAVLEVIAFLEDELEIKVEDSEMIPDNLSSIDRMLAFVERKQVAAA